MDVRMTDETLFPAEFMANDPTLNKMIGNFGVMAEKVKEISRSVVSIKVQGIKLDEKS
jgi:hypothetical protein